MKEGSPGKPIVVSDEEECKDSRRKRRRVGAGGESVRSGAQEAPPVRRRSVRVRPPAPVASRQPGQVSRVVPAKRPIDSIAPKPLSKAAVSLKSKTGTGRLAIRPASNIPMLDPSCTTTAASQSKASAAYRQPAAQLPPTTSQPLQ